jgi:hypothetical protein
MKTIEKRGTFEETANYQNLYHQLLSACDNSGTVVMKDRLVERDQDIAPFRFFRRGTVEYVFPKQKATLEEDRSRMVDPSPEYTLRAEKQVFKYNPAAVQGRIRIEYNDADNAPCLRVVDVLTDSSIPEPVKKALDDML